MSESGDFDPGPWQGHDFKSAYAHYDSHVGRGYQDAVQKRITARDCLEPMISTNCTNPLVIIPDVTGSMEEWPKTMFSKLPYLELEAQEYLGKDLQIAFGAIGDRHSANPDKYPLQMRPFANGTALKERMLELVIESGGGCNMRENYEQAALYAVHQIDIPNAIRPILIFIGDEQPYDHITVQGAMEVAGVTIPKQISTKAVFDQLKEKFAVYLIRKTYRSSGSDAMSEEDREIRNHWVKLIGADHICDLGDPARVVDSIFGILAQETGRVEYFQKEIEGRQNPGQVATVYKSLASIHRLPGKGRTRANHGQSVLKIEDKGRPVKRLLGPKDK